MVKEGNTKSIDKCEGGIAIDTVVIPSTRSTEASPESSRAGSQGRLIPGLRRMANRHRLSD